MFSISWLTEQNVEELRFLTEFYNYREWLDVFTLYFFINQPFIHQIKPELPTSREEQLVSTFSSFM